MNAENERFRFDISLEDLQTFLAVTECGSFVGAAKLLHLSQPSVSNRIRRLEKKLYTRLLDRTTRRVELTPRGRLLYLQSSETLTRLRMLLGEFTGEAAARAREVHVGATMMIASLGLPYLVRLFREAQPGLRAAVHDLFPEEVISEILSGDCDLGVMSVDEAVPGIDFEPLFEDTCVVVTRLGHPLLDYESAPLAEVLKEPLVSPKGLHNLSGAINAEAQRHGLTVKLAPEAQGVRNTFTLLSMAVTGLGVCIHPSSFIPPVLLPMIGIVPLGDATIIRTYGLLTAENRELTLAAKQFRDFMRSAVQPGPRPWHPDNFIPARTAAPRFATGRMPSLA